MSMMRMISGSSYDDCTLDTYRFHAEPHRSIRALSSNTMVPSGVSFAGASYSGGYTRNACNSGFPLAKDRRGSMTIASHGFPWGSSARCHWSCVLTSVDERKQ